MIKFAPEYKSDYIELIPEVYRFDKDIECQTTIPDDYRFGVFTFSSQNKNPNQRLRKISANTNTDSK